MKHSITVQIFKQANTNDEFIIETDLCIEFKLDGNTTELITNIDEYKELNPSIEKSIDYEISRFVLNGGIF